MRICVCSVRSSAGGQIGKGVGKASLKSQPKVPAHAATSKLRYVEIALFAHLFVTQIEALAAILVCTEDFCSSNC